VPSACGARVARAAPVREAGTIHHTSGTAPLQTEKPPTTTSLPAPVLLLLNCGRTQIRPMQRHEAPVARGAAAAYPAAQVAEGVGLQVVHSIGVFRRGPSHARLRLLRAAGAIAAVSGRLKFMKTLHSNRRRFLAAAGAGFALSGILGRPAAAQVPGPGAPTGAGNGGTGAPFTQFPTRTMVMGTHAMVSAGHELAAEAAVRVLHAGGNMVDAALAGSGVLQVVRPFTSGLGGDLFGLIHDGATGNVVAINASGGAPHAATIDWFRSQGLATVPSTGLLSVEVPGLVGGWALLAERYASWDLGTLLAPAISYAAEGFPVYPKLARSSAQAIDLLQQFPATASLFLPGGKPLQTGDLLVQRHLADSLRAVASAGRDAMYGGPLGDAIGRYFQDQGGLLAPADFATAPGEAGTPISSPYRGYSVYELPPVSQGFILLEELNLASGFDVAALGHNTADAIHMMVEAKKLAFADRLAYLGDPGFVPLELEAILSPTFADARRSGIDMKRAADPPVAAFDLRARGTDTTYICVCDAAGNAASIIQSINGAWGSGVVVPGTGILMNNRAQNFWLEEGVPNSLAPGKRTAHTLTSFLVKRGSELVMLGGTPGADDQAQTNFQVVANVLDHGMDVQQALDATKWSSSPGTLERDNGQPYVLSVEPRLDESIVADLVARGHRVQRVADYSIGAHKAIVRNISNGVLMGGASPVRDGYAIGW
jgi:gamma-glutamyltranspeptidase / glutathione hydrolase